MKGQTFVSASGVPKSWSFDPVTAGFRRLLAGRGLGALVDRAAMCRCVVDGRHRGTTEGVDPEVFLLIKRHLPIRVSLSSGLLTFAVAEYTMDGGLRATAYARHYSEQEAPLVKGDARRGFVQLRRDLLARTVYGLGIMSAAPGVLGLAPVHVASGSSDMVWLAGQLSASTGGLKVVPIPLADRSRPAGPRGAETEVDGVRVRPGQWVFVSLRTRSGLVMTEPAIFVGAERLGAATRLVLRNTDGVTSSCWTRGPGWVRSVVPAREGDLWELMMGRPAPAADHETCASEYEEGVVPYGRTGGA